MSFPSALMKLLIEHSSLGVRAPQILAAIEARVAAGATVYPRQEDQYRALSQTQPGLVFIWWDNSAQGLKSHLTDNQHTVIESSHPSPIGGSCWKGFFGSNPFSRSNASLIARGKPPINWIESFARLIGTTRSLF